MRIKIFGLFCVAAVIASGHGVLAADMPVKAAPLVPIYNWSGFYIGGHAGYGWAGQRDVAISPLPQPGFGTLPFNANLNAKGFLGGAQFGWNWQSGRLVYGVEADLSGTGINDNQRTLTLPVGAQVTVEEKLKWLGTMRGRIGTTVTDRTLVYVTGGLAVGNYNLASTYAFIPDVAYPSSRNVTKVGWTLGGGAEFALAGNWTAKAEYLYFDLGKETLDGLPVPANPPFHVQSEFKLNGHIVRVGVNYKFGGR